MRLTLAIAAFAAVWFYSIPASQAYMGNDPWCAFIDIGTGEIFEDCQYRTLEECVPNVLAGNRGTCNPNPRWEGATVPVLKQRPHRKRHINRH
jgi:hypothetical protein